MAARIDIESPRFDQSTNEGRARHFFITTNPLNVLKSNDELEAAKRIVDSYRKGMCVCVCVYVSVCVSASVCSRPSATPLNEATSPPPCVGVGIHRCPDSVLHRVE